MAKSITKRTLVGFHKAKTNMWAPEDLVNKVKNQSELFIKKVHDLIGKDMKINAIAVILHTKSMMEVGHLTSCKSYIPNICTDSKTD